MMRIRQGVLLRRAAPVGRVSGEDDAHRRGDQPTNRQGPLPDRRLAEGRRGRRRDHRGHGHREEHGKDVERLAEGEHDGAVVGHRNSRHVLRSAVRIFARAVDGKQRPLAGGPAPRGEGPEHRGANDAARRSAGRHGTSRRSAGETCTLSPSGRPPSGWRAPAEAARPRRTGRGCRTAASPSRRSGHRWTAPDRATAGPRSGNT